jgi:hypothetical protein
MSFTHGISTEFILNGSFYDGFIAIIPDFYVFISMKFLLYHSSIILIAASTSSRYFDITERSSANDNA